MCARERARATHSAALRRRSLPPLSAAALLRCWAPRRPPGSRPFDPRPRLSGALSDADVVVLPRLPRHHPGL
eukprot:6517770-Prymnesium_polylepis.3